MEVHVSCCCNHQTVCVYRAPVNKRHIHCAVIIDLSMRLMLGPALFLVFINDLPDSIANFVKIFADDTKVYSTISTISDSDFNKLQSDLTKSSDWSDIWELRFNAKKCKSLHIGRNNPRHQYYMYESGIQVPVEQVESEKDLGVTFESTLRFDYHISRTQNDPDLRLQKMSKYVVSALF